MFAPYGEGDMTFSVEPTTSASDATVFGVTNACAFGTQDLGFLADVSSNTAAAVFFDTPGNIRDGGYILPVCSVNGGIMSCDFEGANEFALCPDGSNVSASDHCASEPMSEPAFLPFSHPFSLSTAPATYLWTAHR